MGNCSANKSSALNVIYLKFKHHIITCMMLLWRLGIPSHDSSVVGAAVWSLEKDDVLLIELLCVHFVWWGHAVAVAETMNIYLAVSLSGRTGTAGLQLGLQQEGAGALRVGRDGRRLHGMLWMGLGRRHGGFLKIWRVGGDWLSVWHSAVWSTKLICQWHIRDYFRTKEDL